MVDVRLLYSLDKTEAAARLAEGISAAGYGVEREALADGRAFPDVAAEAGKSKALLLIWSRGLVSAAMEGGRLASMRRHSNLIEISADGIEPAGTEPSPVILLCGWRGQPYHQGWQRILSEVRRLCGSGNEARKSPLSVPPKVPERSSAGASRPGRRPVRAAVAAGALIAAVVGAGALYERGGGDSDPRAEARPAISALSGQPSHPSLAEAVPPAAGAPPLPQAAAVTAGPAQPGPVLAAAPARATAGPAEPPPRPRAERTRTRPSATSEKRSSPARLAAASGGEVKRYSRKHSKTMRLFCQRSGRSTPQCRTFVRSMRERDG